MPEQKNATRLQVLQICHDYAGPFVDICRLYNGAFKNADVTTLYLRGDEDAEVTRRTGGDVVVYLGQIKGSLRGIKFSTIFQVAKLFRTHQYDLVIAHRYKAIYLAGIMSYFFPIPVILGVAHEHSVFKRITRALFVTFWRKNIQLLAVSKSVEADILVYCPGLKAEGRIHTIGNAIDVTQRTSLLSRQAARAELGIGNDTFCYGTVGRLVEKKEHELLLAAYARVAQPDNRLLILGSGPRENALKALAEELGIRDQVIFAGRVDEAFRIYSAFDVFVFCSGEREAFGIVLLEAMLAEVPIVCTDAEGPRSVVADTALVFESGSPNDLVGKMQELENMTSKDRVELAAKAKERLNSYYTSEVFSRELNDIPVLKALVKKRSEKQSGRFATKNEGTR